MSTGLFPSVTLAVLLWLPRPDRLTPSPCAKLTPESTGWLVGAFGMTMLGILLASPMLDILLLFVMPSGLVAPALPFVGNGLTGLTTPDMAFLGVGGKGERAGGIGLCI